MAHLNDFGWTGGFSERQEKAVTLFCLGQLGPLTLKVYGKVNVFLFGFACGVLVVDGDSFVLKKICLPPGIMGE